VTPASSMSWRCRRVRSSGSHRLTPALVATAAEVAIAMLKRRVAPHQAEGWSNPRAWTILDARGRSPNVRSSSQPTVRPRSRGSLPRLPYVRIAYIVAEVALVAPELMSHPARSHHHRTRGEGDERNIKDAARNVKKSPAGAGLFTRGLNFTRKPGCSVANLDARSIPNASIPIPNRRASGPVAVRRNVHGCGRDVDGGRCVIAGAARNRSSKQRTNGQATNHAGGYVTTPCNRNPGCTRQTKTSCDEQADQQLSHFEPL
jgi:hypothetical protein